MPVLHRHPLLPPSGSGRGSHCKLQDRQLSLWLGTGALTVGLSAAVVAGAGASWADTGQGASSSSTADRTTAVHTAGPARTTAAKGFRAGGLTSLRAAESAAGDDSSPPAATGVSARVRMRTAAPGSPSTSPSLAGVPSTSAPPAVSGPSTPEAGQLAAAADASPASAASASAVDRAVRLADLVRNIPVSKPMSLRIDTISDNANGVAAIVVYASGVAGFPEGWNLLNPFSWGNMVSTWLQAGFSNVTGLSNRRVSAAIDKVVTYVDTNYPDTYVPIILVGHSNGGQQLETYAATGTYKDRVLALYTFGSPAIKNASEFSDQTLVFDVQDVNDPVPWSVSLNPFRKQVAATYLTSFDELDNFYKTHNPEGVWGGDAPKMIYYVSTRNWGPWAHAINNYKNIASTFDQLADIGASNYILSVEPILFTGQAVVNSWKVAYGTL